MLTAILLAGYSCAHEFIPRWIPTTPTKCCLLSCKRGQTHWNRYRKNSNVHASTPTQKKNMHKIRLYIVFISIRASQKMLLVSTDLILCFCFHPIFSRWSFFFLFFFPFLFRCCCRLKRMHLADCVMDLRAEEKTSNSLRYGSIRRRSLTAIFSKPDISQCLQTGSLFPYWRVQMPTSGEGQPFNPFKNPPQHGYWNFIFRKKERKKEMEQTHESSRWRIVLERGHHLNSLYRSHTFCFSQ